MMDDTFMNTLQEGLRQATTIAGGARGITASQRGQMSNIMGEAGKYGLGLQELEGRKMIEADKNKTTLESVRTSTEPHMLDVQQKIKAVPGSASILEQMMSGATRGYAPATNGGYVSSINAGIGTPGINSINMDGISGGKQNSLLSIYNR